MKKTLLALGMAAIATTVAFTSLADISQTRFNTLEIKTSEPIGYPLVDYVDPITGTSTYNAISPIQYVSDIDSISIDMEAQRVYLRGSRPDDPSYRFTSYLQLSMLQGFNFTFLQPWYLSSPLIYGETRYEDRNTVSIVWKPIEGAAGYEVRYVNHIISDPKTFDWEDANENFGTFIINDPSATSCLISNLNYSSIYSFAVRALSANGEAYNSIWSARNDFRELWGRYLSLSTAGRYAVPTVVKSITEKRLDGFTVNFDLTYNRADYSAADADTIEARFPIVDGKFVADKIIATNTSSNEKIYHTLTADELAAGKVTITGLCENTIYSVCLMNSAITPEIDAAYNDKSVRTKGTPGEPIVLTGGSEGSSATDLYPILDSYISDNSLSEGQIFYLQGDRHYEISMNTNIAKGLTLATLPEDLAAGKRAKVHLSRINPTGSLQVSNFMLGLSSSEIDIESIIFRGIDFDAPHAVKYGEGSGATGNYFINCYSTCPGLHMESLEMYNCTFSGFVRGHVRIQGSKPLSIGHFITDGCLFYDCGYYDINGRGYAWFAGDGNLNHNIYSDFRFTNNTIYDSPRTCLITDNDKNLDYPDDVKWNIRVENNTFINFSTRSYGRNFFQLRYIPGGSYISFKRNLIALAAADDEARDLYQYGADIREVKGSGEFSFEIKDNYSVGCRDSHLYDDGIFTSSQSFVRTSNSFGSPIWTPGNLGTPEDLIVKVGSTPLKSTDLFTAPLNDPSAMHKAPANIMEALTYRMTPQITNHEIFTKNIGDPRWKELAIENFNGLFDEDIKKDNAYLLYGSESSSTPRSIDPTIQHYNEDSSMPEGQVFYLRGDCYYSINSSLSLCKGLTLATDPDDLAQGKRAKLYMSSLVDGRVVAYNFNLGRQQMAGVEEFELQVSPITLQGIDFDASHAVNYDLAQSQGTGVTGNYFLNCYSNILPAHFESIEMKDCTFKGFIRGHMRIQGARSLNIDHLITDGCLFYDCGYYDMPGRGYAWFAGDGNVSHNIYSDFRFTNNTIYDSPRTSFITDGDKNIEYPEDTKWNIRVENNTFINFSTCSTGRNFFQLRYIPGGSYISFQRNLIALAAADDDTRDLYQYGADIREVKGSGEFSFEIKDNYSVGCRDSHLYDDGIFTSNQSFARTSNSFGSPIWTPGNLGTPEDLIVKVGSTPLKSTDLFTAPLNDPSAMHKAPANIMEALKYRDTDLVKTHEIYTKNIGDQRWK